MTPRKQDIVETTVRLVDTVLGGKDGVVIIGVLFDYIAKQPKEKKETEGSIATGRID